ncbi:uncharacterized protein METZ01_LOCUS67756 [marine metagenome]|uniref:Sulfatase N-terminal domain-containing protein n=1 Tax=marine metagenome TaxID=408172 RepID=A0A381TFH8_9ZZZZ
MNDYNILVIIPDQLRADYLSCYGHPSIATQHIDRLASQGARFDNCYCQSPLCAPSRVSFATSTYVGEHGCRNYWSTIDPQVPNLVTTLKQAGYRTGMFGKNHLFTYDKLPELWDECNEICLGNYDGHREYKKAYSSFELEEDHNYNITGRLTQETIDFMGHADRPFFAWVNYQDPHPAFTCPAPYKDMFDPEEIELPESYHQYDTSKQPVRNEVWRQHSEMDSCTETDMRKAIATYMGQIRYVDDGVGDIMSMLEDSGLDKKTIVLFLSDHGELIGSHRMTHKLPAFYDCLTKIPVIIRHPDGRWAGSTVEGLTEEIDLVPTVLETAGIAAPPTMVGTSYKEDLDSGFVAGKESVISEAGGGAPTWKEPIDGYTITAPKLPTSLGPGAMLRKGDWKLSIYEDDLCELYNLKDDPEELVNLYESKPHAEVRNELTLLLLKRTMGVKKRDVGMVWPFDEYPIDVRFESLLKFHGDNSDITGVPSDEDNSPDTSE